MEKPKGINILITGTPGTGKTSMAALLKEELAADNFTHIEIGKVIKEHGFFTEFDSEFQTHIIEEDDEDRLLDYLEPLMVNGGNHVVDYHASELFPKRWFHLVVVLHASTEVLFDRLTARGYSEAKRDENMEAEIQMVCDQEARDSYDESIILSLLNDTLEQMMGSVETIAARVEAIKEARGIQ